MRTIRNDELKQAAGFITDRFWGLELLSYLSQGMKDGRATIQQSILSELGLFFDKGNIFVYDDDITALLAGITSKNYSLFNQVIYGLKIKKSLKHIDKEDFQILLERNKSLTAIHSVKPWYKKYTKRCYYISQLAVSRECKGQGIFRKMITPVIEKCERNGLDLVLETFTASNVPIYEHFGFKCVEVHSSEALPFSEYCLVRLTQNKQ